MKEGFVDKSGAWYAYNGEKIGQGKDKSRNYLKEHPEIAAEIDAKIREKLLPEIDVSTSNAEAEFEEA